MNYADINTKYEKYDFSNINYIDLFELTKISQIDHIFIKKYITTKYYSLALKYHPDKYKNNLSNISNIIVDSEDIKTGIFLSYINDIYKYLLFILINEYDNMVCMINDTYIINNHDCLYLKMNIKDNVYIKPSDQQLKDFQNNLINIKDEKINDYTLNKLIDDEKINRNLFKIEQIFTTKDITDNKFINKFNTKFEINSIINDEIIQEIQPYNYDITIISKSISLLEEAYAPIKINKYNNIIYTYNDIINAREEQDIIFKNPKISLII